MDPKMREDQRESENGSTQSRTSIFESTTTMMSVSTLIWNVCRKCICQESNTAKKNTQALVMLGLIILPLFPILTLIIQNGFSLSHLVTSKSDMIVNEVFVRESEEISDTIQKLQEERAYAVYLISLTTNNGPNISLHSQRIKETFIKTDLVLSKISNWQTDENDIRFDSQLRFQIRLEDFRELFLKSATASADEDIIAIPTTIQDIMLYYNSLNDVLMNQLSVKISKVKTKDVWRYVVAYESLVRVIEHIGREIMFGVLYTLNKKLDEDESKEVYEEQQLSQDYLEMTQSFIPSVAGTIKLAQSDQDFLIYASFKMENGQMTLSENKTSAQYYYSSIAYVKKIQDAKNQIRDEINKSVHEQVKLSDRQQAIGILILVIVLIVSPFMILLSRNAVQTIQIFSKSLQKKSADLRTERKKTEKLLYKMLPEIVADGLKNGNTTTETFKSATIGFINIDDFSTLTKMHSPIEVINILNEIYTVFDSRLDLFNVYKVETINDSYLVASGLPKRNETHCREIAGLCLDITKTCQTLDIQPELTVRVSAGVHSGLVVAGIVGSKMPRYCLFGDTVNIASRMQSTGEPGRIQITSATRTLLETQGDDFQCEVRGVIEVKGKGSMETYWLVSQISKRA